jgi:hypothetical protein
MQTTRRKGPTLDGMSLDQQSDVTDRYRGPRRPTERIRIVVIAVLVAVLAVAGGLVIANVDRGGRGVAPPTPSAAPPSAPPSVDPRTAAGEAALAVYERYVDLLARSFAAPTREPIEGLDDVAKDPARADAFLSARGLAIAGNRQTGAVEGPPTVTEVQLLSTPPSVRIERCLDTSQIRITTATGESLQNSSPSRAMGTVLLHQLDGRWYVISVTGKKAPGGGIATC